MFENIYVHESSSIKYDVIFTHNIFDQNNKILLPYIQNRKSLIIISPTINKIYGEKLRSFFKNYSSNIVVIETGEHNKNIDSIITILKEAKKTCLDRRGLMICIGGGILMDIVGFAASMFRRKIDYLRIPTTLIGQVDAGIGIKTGINFEGSKNFIGAFYPPIACINSIDFLATLTEKEIRNGLAEIIKMAIICDAELFNLVENNFDELLSTKFQCSLALEIIFKSSKEMIRELTTNFYEESLERLVDFGHTFSPFIETYSNYTIPHGYAVGLDIALTTEISFILNKIDVFCRNRIHSLIEKTVLNLYDHDTFITNLMWDSLSNILNHRGGALNLPIPIRLGNAIFISKIEEISLEILDCAIENLKNNARREKCQLAAA